jgi:transposase InsO family protein
VLLFSSFFNSIADSNALSANTWRSWEKYGIVSSKSRPVNPYDNANCESFMKTLRREIYANRYDNLEHLHANIEEFIEQYYPNPS